MIGTLLCSVLLLYGSPVLQCARGSPRFYLLGDPPLARPRGRDPPSASFISRPFFLACLILSSGFLSPGYSFNPHGSRAASVRGHPNPAPGSVEPATLHLAHRCLQGSTRSRYPSFSPLLRCVPEPKGPPQVKRPRSLTLGRVSTSKSFHTASLSLLASLRPQSFLGASPVAQSSTTSPPVRVRLPLGHQNPNGISTPARSLRRQPPLSSASGSPQPAALPVAAAPIPGLPPVFFWGRPYPVSQSPCASSVCDLTWAPWSPPAPPPPPESLLGASRCSVPSAHSPLRLSAPRKAAASAACLDPQTPKSLTGRFGTPGVAAGAHTRSAPSSGLAPQPGPHSARGRHDFDFLLAGPSGAKSSGVRHLRVLGHAPHVDNILVCSATEEICREDIVGLLCTLANKGYKVDKNKLQNVQKEVHYLGQLISKDGRKVTPDRVESIKNMPKPTTTKQIQQFLGLCNYVRQWVFDYATLTAPLLIIWKDSKFEGPYLVTQSTSTAVKVEGRKPWIHLSDIRQAPVLYQALPSAQELLQENVPMEK
ncbi:hypothetical protein NDU88_005873 [Pleurodeles waltl]|uniref:Uncharacterized protein n=1 Tax=Pleurodeles waltl TaxID=8319 RepID=A0AAV7PKT7_PLEWA|nr:hypothetical protein NDU88_005873 [Pleurodeles waltl]